VTGDDFDLRGKPVWLAGHRGLVGSAIARRLSTKPMDELATATSAEVDPRDQARTERLGAGVNAWVVGHAHETCGT